MGDASFASLALRFGELTDVAELLRRKSRADVAAASLASSSGITVEAGAVCGGLIAGIRSLNKIFGCVGGQGEEEENIRNDAYKN